LHLRLHEEGEAIGRWKPVSVSRQDFNQPSGRLRRKLLFLRSELVENGLGVAIVDQTAKHFV
jgi:hypothetical protein